RAVAVVRRGAEARRQARGRQRTRPRHALSHDDSGAPHRNRSGMIEIDASKPSVAPSAPACTVLCVDDEPNILAALKRTLRSAGFAALTADGGAEAIEILEKLPVDVVVSDMRMPGIDGAQLLEQVHARWPHVVRILLTGHADQGSTVSAIN